MGSLEMRFLNSRERKHFFAALKEQYGYEGSTEYLVFENGQNKFYLLNQSAAVIDWDGVRPKHAGLYVANQMHEELRLTMDGAQLLSNDCSHEKIVLTGEQQEQWMRGEDVATEQEDTPFSIVMCGEDVLGCGKIKDGYLLNYVPKGRWILDPH